MSKRLQIRSIDYLLHDSLPILEAVHSSTENFMDLVGAREPTAQLFPHPRVASKIVLENLITDGVLWGFVFQVIPTDNHIRDASMNSQKHLTGMLYMKQYDLNITSK